MLIRFMSIKRNIITPLFCAFRLGASDWAPHMASIPSLPLPYSYRWSCDCVIKYLHPRLLRYHRLLLLLPLLNVLRVLLKCPVESFLVWVIVFPISHRFSPVNFIVFCLLVGFITLAHGVVGGERGWRVGSTFERCWNFCFVLEFFFFVLLSTFFLWVSLVGVLAKEIVGSCVSKSFFHVVCHHSFETKLDLSIFVSCVELLVLELLHVLVLWMLHQLLFSTGHESLRMNGKICLFFDVKLVCSEWVPVGVVEVRRSGFGEQLGSNFLLHFLIHFYSFFWFGDCKLGVILL